MLGRGTAVLRSALESPVKHAVMQLFQRMGQLSVKGAENGAATLPEEDALLDNAAQDVSLRMWAHSPCWSMDGQLLILAHG